MCNLAKDLLNVDEIFHEAIFDVTVLKALCATLLPISVFKTYRKTVDASYALLLESKYRSLNRPLLKPLKGVSSKGMCDKIA